MSIKGNWRRHGSEVVIRWYQSFFLAASRLAIAAQFCRPQREKNLWHQGRGEIASKESPHSGETLMLQTLTTTPSKCYNALWTKSTRKSWRMSIYNKLLTTLVKHTFNYMYKENKSKTLAYKLLKTLLFIFQDCHEEP